jgi:tRNA pseudouridine synthase 10
MAEISDRVREIVSKCDICDECLGRQFHAIMPKMPNREIGKALRICIGLEDASNGKSTEYAKYETCQLCKNLFSNADKYVEKIILATKDYEYDTFLVGSIFPADTISKEEDFWEEYGIDSCESIKSNFNRSVGLKFREKTGKQIEFENPDIMAIIDVEKDEIILQISPIYIKGGYKKVLPKSKVQKYIEGTLMEKTLGKEAIFFSVGRLEENTLTSTYRPFVLMIRSPQKRNLKLQKIRKEINERKSLQVSKLSLSNKEGLDSMKSDKIAANFMITLKFEKLTDDDKKEISEIIKSLRKKRVMQVLKQKVRKPYMRKMVPKFDGNKLSLELETTVGFSVNSFLSGKSRPNLEKSLDRKFEVESIVLRRFKTMKAKDMY